MKLVRNIIMAIDNLPTLPTIYSAISDAIADSRTSAESLAKIIAADQVSAIRVLKIANSPAFGFRGKIETISQAVFYLGFKEIRNIIFALSVMHTFSRAKAVSLFKVVDFWQHSIATGIATRLIGKGTGVDELENFFLAGVLHDIGKLIFFQFAEKDFEQALTIASTRNLNLPDAELNIFEANHAVAGQLLATKWGLPEQLQNAIYFHHTGIMPGKADKLVAAVHVGDIIAKLLQLGHAGNEFIPHPDPAIWDILNLPDKYFSNMRKQLLIDYHETLKVMLYE